MPVKSRKQAGLFGAAAAGRSTKATGLSKTQAREALRGQKLKGLPTRVRKGRK